MSTVALPDRPVGRPFEILPAIDLLDGRVVRLLHGRFDRATVYAQDPVGVARGFAEGGAGWLHVVDLDGARAGRPIQLAAVGRIARAIEGRARIQLGGGIRSLEAARAALDAGAQRVVVGTRAVREPAFAAALVTALGPEAVVVALDVRHGRVVGEAWRAGAEGEAAEAVVRALAAAGVADFAVTAIERDGSMEGPDLGLLRGIASLGAGEVIASGGFATIDDVLAARTAGCRGAILGRSLYEGRIDLAGVLARLA